MSTDDWLVTILITAIILGVPLSFYYIGEQVEIKQKKEWAQLAMESIERDSIFVSNFKTLTDCTEMTIQLTEKNRFWNETFKSQIHNHYREICG